MQECLGRTTGALEAHYSGLNTVLNSCVRGGRDGLAATDIGSVASTADDAFPVRTASDPGSKIQKKLFSIANVVCQPLHLWLIEAFEFGDKGVWPKSCRNVVMATELANSDWKAGETPLGLYQMSLLKRTDTWAMRNPRAAQFLSRQGSACNLSKSARLLGSLLPGSLSC